MHRMMGISEMSFKDPWFLLGLILVPLYLYAAYAKKGENGFRLGLPSLSNLQFGRSWRKILFQTMPVLKAIGFSLLIIAMARPQYAFQKQKISSEGIDIVIALDLSMSMLAKDFEPDRLAVAKEVISGFIENREGDRIGLTAFAGESYTACPPTLDHKVVQEFVKGLQYGQIKDGTAIGMGISTSVNRLMDSDAKSKIIILVTDGSNNSGVVDPMDAAEIAQTLGIKVYTIGVGTNGRALMPSFAFGKIQYRYANVEIDEQLLNVIASNTGGVYFRAKNEAELKQIYNYINDLEKSEFDSSIVTRREDKYEAYLFWGFLCLLGHFGLKLSLFRNINT